MRSATVRENDFRIENNSWKVNGFPGREVKRNESENFHFRSIRSDCCDDVTPISLPFLSMAGSLQTERYSLDFAFGILVNEFFTILGKLFFIEMNNLSTT